MKKLATLFRAKTLNSIVWSLSTHTLLICSSVVFILPIFWMVSTSLKVNKQIFTFPPTWTPHPLMWSNYLRAVKYIPFFLYLGNSLFVVSISILVTICSCTIVAYGFSRIRWTARDVVFILVLATMMLPYQVILIPQYLIFVRLGWVGTFRPLWVPYCFGNAFFVFLLRQFFMTIPFELGDAAKIDGCSEFGIFLKIILPLCKPALVTVALFSFVWRWNDFLAPLVYLTDESKYTLALGLQQFQSQVDTEWALVMSVATLMTLPVIVLFFFAQKTFIQGISVTGIKG